MAVRIKKGEALALLNLTPIIDVVFNLLIFFLVATKFEEEERSLNVLLPQASEAQPHVSQPKELFVNVNERGQYFVGGKFLGEGELELALRRAATNNPGRQKVVIRADQHCVWQYVVNVMNLCQKAGIRDCVTTVLPNGG